MSLVERITKDDLTRHSAIMISAGIGAGLLNYIYQVVMGSLLSREEYGALFSLLSLSMIVATAAQTFQNAASRFTSTFRVGGNLGKIKSLWTYLLWRTLLLGLVVFLILVLVTPLVSRFLRLEDSRCFIVLSSSFLLGFAISVNQGLIQGLQRFLPLGFCQVLLPVTKISLGVLLVYVGLGVNGALLPLLIGGAIVFGVSLLFVRDVAQAKAERCEVTGLGSYTGLTFVAVVSCGVLMNVDVVMAKHYLSPERAGDYAAMAVLGRMALYAPMGIGAAMFPKTSELFESGRDPQRAMRKAMLYTLIAGGMILLVYCFLHGFIIDFAFRGAYEIGMVDLLKYGLSMLLIALSSLMVNYFLSVNQTKIAYVALATSLLVVALLAVFHSGVGQYVDVMLVCGAVSLLLTLPFYVRDRKRYQS